MARLKRDLVGCTLKIANANSIGQLTSYETATLLQAIRLFNLEDWPKDIGVTISTVAAIAGVPKSERRSIKARLSRNQWLVSNKSHTELGKQFANLTAIDGSEIDSINKSMNKSLVSNHGAASAAVSTTVDEVRGLLKMKGLTNIDDKTIEGAIAIANARGVTKPAAYAAGVIKKQVGKATGTTPAAGAGADDNGADENGVYTIDPTTGETVAK